jgi:transcriptional regulator with XRE-family HTH domain
MYGTYLGNAGSWSQVTQALLKQIVGLRRERMSQAEVAKRMGVSKQRVSNLEKGTSAPTLKTLEKYAEAVGATVLVKGS